MLDSPKELAFDRLTRLASQLLKAPISLVTILDEGRQFFKSSYGLHEPWESDRQTPLTHSICQYVVREDAPVIVHDTLTDCRLTENLAREDIGVGSVLVQPEVDTAGKCRKGESRGLNLISPFGHSRQAFSSPISIRAVA